MCFSLFYRPYNNMTLCLERLSRLIGCHYPNPDIEDFFLHVHSLYFHSCSKEELLLVDPPSGLVIALTLIPVSLIPILVYLVVWKSKVQEWIVLDIMLRKPPPHIIWYIRENAPEMTVCGVFLKKNDNMINVGISIRNINLVFHWVSLKEIFWNYLLPGVEWDITLTSVQWKLI